jgi:tRNA(fMet)-specific endonuclease VapC
MIGLDTTAIIDLFKGDPELNKFIQNSREPFSVTILSYAELMFGLNENSRKEEEYYDDFFSDIYSFDLTKDSCKIASKLKYSLRKKGITIGNFDLLIASIFLSNGITKILTRNKKHFERINSIEVISY